VRRQWILALGALALGCLFTCAQAVAQTTDSTTSSSNLTPPQTIEKAPAPSETSASVVHESHYRGDYERAPYGFGGPGYVGPGYDGYGFDPVGDDCCGHHGHCWTCVGGVGVHVLRPRWNNNPAYVVSQSTVDGVTPAISSLVQTDFEWDTEVAPLIWLGIRCGNDFGVRTRYWRFDEDVDAGVINNEVAGSSEVVIDSAGPLGITVGGFDALDESGDRLDVESDLRIDVWDLELTQEYRFYDWSFLLAGGVRYGRIEQNYDATAYFPTSAPNTLVQLRSNHSIDGIGPTAAVEVRRGLCPRLALYGSARGSLLFGTNEQEASRLATVGGTLAGVAQARNEQDDVLPVVELELGGEWFYDCNSGRWLVQAGVFSQTWFGAGNAANSELIGTVGGTQSADDDSYLGLVGVKLTVGFQY
jgi:hypothetical protein